MTLSVAEAESLMKRTLFHDKDLQVCICGGGNGAHVAAGYLAHKGIKVNVLTRKPSQWAEQMKVITAGSSWSGRGTFFGRLQTVSKNPATVIPKSRVIIIAAPANAHPALLERIKPYVDEGAAVGALYGQGGFDWAAKTHLGEKMDKCGMNSVPRIDGTYNKEGELTGGSVDLWTAKYPMDLQDYKIWTPFCWTLKHEVRIIGPKKSLYVACYPLQKKEEAARLMEELFDIPTANVPNFLSLTLTPSNQIIHPGRYYGIFRDWDGKKSYTLEELKRRKGMTLYADMDEFSAEQMAMLDNELQQVKDALLQVKDQLEQKCQRFPALDLSDVLPLGERVIKHYGEDVKDVSSLRSIFATNLGYAGCATPLVEVSPGQFIPNVDSRLFWEDIPFGLCILKSMAELLGNFPTPRIDFMIRWHQQFMGVTFLNEDSQLNPATLHLTGTPYKYGIHSIEDLVMTSLQDEMRSYRHPRSRL